jgi:sec-independent protein translocase protein TatA
MGISFWQIAIIVLIVVLLFGAGKIPRLMKDVGSGINQFKRGLKEEAKSEEDEAEADANTAQLSKTEESKAGEASAKSEEDKKVANG